jgi:membrane fusion protein (multidrug efflux system)
MNRISAPKALIFIALFGLSACHQGPDQAAKAEESAKVPVEAASVSRRPISASYSGTATLEADREADVVAKTSGVLLKLYVEEGAVVKEGQLLAKLDDASPRLNLAKVEATLRKLESDYRRADEMFSKKLLSSEEHDKIRYDLENQRAAYDLAKLDLSYTAIAAPIGGIVGKRMVKEGNLIQLNQALFHIVDPSPLLGILSVPERELGTLKPGQAVSMQVDALPGVSFDGDIDRISPVVDANSGTFRVTCAFHDDSRRLKPGMFGRIDVVYDRKQDALAIPRSALIEEDGQTAVYVVGESAPKPDAAGKEGKDAKKADTKAIAKTEAKPGKVAKPPQKVLSAQRRPVQVGYSDADFVEVRDGLKEGERVITVGRNAVRDGTEVQVLENQPKALAKTGGAAKQEAVQ